MMSKSRKLGVVGKISPRAFQPYQDLILTHPDIGVMAVRKRPKLTS
ncbi:hypothetical protein MTR67_033826 [Solanum verrucosum]|uniref:Uncharacterized protein n=1 Tax=Solanum verrucosum TaxID=315347 RepID=A0AAF0ZHY1_SOLVR|nr:hypothetical protein MTR67_033826 [Solanum verrucosum]